MSDFNVRSDSVDVEQVMEQIRARIREKRGVDYTEEQIRELAGVKLEKFLDPRGLRSDLLAEFHKLQAAPKPYAVPLYPFDDSTLFDSRRGIVRFFRRLFRPLMKLVLNTNALSQSLHHQSEINRLAVERLDQLETNAPLYYELLHNLVLELTRTSIDVKNAKMRVESIASRLEFNERRARALESVVAYKATEPAESARGGSTEQTGAGQPPPRQDRRYEGRTEGRQESRPDSRRQEFAPQAPPGIPPPSGNAAPPPGGTTGGVPGEGPGQRSRRRRRRRGRRGGASAVATMGGGEGASGQTPPPAPASPPAEPQADDGREVRRESIENTFGASLHPAEPPIDTSGASPAPLPERPPEPSEPDDQ